MKSANRDAVTSRLKNVPAFLGFAMVLAGLLLGAASQCAAGERIAPTSQPGELAASQPDVDREVGQAVKAWATGNFQARESASRRLVELGPAVLFALKDAVTSDDPEVATRARSVIRQLKYGLPATASQQEKNFIQQFIDAKELQAKVAAVRNLITQGPNCRLAALTIARVEPDAELAAAVNQEILERAGEFAGMLMALGRSAEAERLIDQPAVRHSAAQFRMYAMDRFLRGRADEAIRQEEAVAADQRDYRLLAGLYLAKGDLAQARAAVEKAPGEDQLFAHIACLQFDWKTAAAAYARFAGESPGGSGAIGQLGLLGRLAGNKDQADKAIEALKTTPAGNNGYDGITDRVQSLLMMEDIDDAIDLCKGNRDEWTVDLLVSQGRFKEALELQPVAADPRIWPTPFRAPLRQADLMHRLGLRDQAKPLLAELLTAARNSQQDYPTCLLADIAAAERTWGMKEESDKHFAEAFLAGSRGKWEQGNPQSAEAMFPKRGEQAQVFWYGLSALHPAESEEKLIGRLKGSMATTQPAERVAELAEQALKNWPAKIQGQVRWNYRFQIVSDACRQAERLDLALSYLEQSGKAFDGGAAAFVPGADYLAREGDLLVEQQRWAEAADRYGRAVRVGYPDGQVLFNQGWALTKAGKKGEGDRLMETARVMPMYPWQRFNLIKLMRDYGLNDQADRQLELALRLGEKLADPTAQDAICRLIKKAMKAKNLAKDLDYRELQCLTDCDDGRYYLNATTYLSNRAWIHAMRACALAGESKMDQAAAEADKALIFVPLDGSFVGHLVSGFDKAGGHKQADTICDKALAAYQKVLKEYPDSAWYLNGAAWTAACCHRKLDGALAMAEQAVKLEPENAAYVDTLAEAHFQLGHRDKAVELSKRSIQLSPEYEPLKQRLGRFQSGSPGTQPD